MNKLVIFISVFFLFSCSYEPGVNAPDNLLSKEQMIAVLYDLGLAEAAYRGRHHKDTLAEEKVRERVLYNFEEHKTTKKQFEASYDYYMKQPEMLVEIYNEVLARYSTRLSEVEEKVD